LYLGFVKDEILQLVCVLGPICVYML